MTTCEYSVECGSTATKSYSTPSGELLVCQEHYTGLIRQEIEAPPNTHNDGRPNTRVSPPGSR